MKSAGRRKVFLKSRVRSARDPYQVHNFGFHPFLSSRPSTSPASPGECEWRDPENPYTTNADSGSSTQFLRNALVKHLVSVIHRDRSSGSLHSVSVATLL